MVTTISGFPYKRQPINNVTPFTYRDGTTFLEEHEDIKQNINEKLIPEINESLDSFREGYLGDVAETETRFSEYVEQIDNRVSSINNRVGPEQAQHVYLDSDKTLEINREWPSNHPVYFTVTQDSVGGHGIAWTGNGPEIIMGDFRVNPEPGAVTAFSLVPTNSGSWIVQGVSHGKYVIKGQTDLRAQIYVSPNGSDDNDGKSPESALATFQAAFNALDKEGPLLQGVWEVIAAPGRYVVQSQQTLTTRSVNRVVVRGPSVGGGVPLVVIDGAGGTNYAHGLAASGVGVRVQFQDIKFIGFTNGANDTSRIALLGDNEADFYALNIHVDGASWAGINCIGTIHARTAGGIVQNCRNGIISVQTHHTVNGTTIKSCSETGATWSRGSHGHADNITFESNAIGMLVTENSNVDANNNEYKRNTYGIKTQIGGYVASGSSSRFNDDNSDKQSGGNFLRMADSGDFQEVRWADRPLRVAYDRTTRSLTGSTAESVITSSYTLPANRISNYGNRLIVECKGTFATLTAGSIFTIAVGDMKLNFVVPAGVTLNGAFRAEMVLMEMQGGHWAYGELLANGGAPIVSQATQTGFTKTATNLVRVMGTLAAASSRIAIYGTDISVIG